MVAASTAAEGSQMTSISIQVPRTIAAPRGAWIAAAAFARLLQILHIGRMERTERRERVEMQHDLARVRRYAQQMMDVDPRFASDLFAAADRYDRDQGAGN
jgi:hypothetical protein